MIGQQELSGNSAHSIDRVAVKVPPFISTDPELWFSMLESSFDAAGITQDNTKFGYVLSGLDQKYALEVRDIIVKPKGERTYELLKSELIKRMGSSQEQNTRRLLESEPLGDRKPSQFLRHLRGLAGTSFPEDVLYTFWLGRLPKHVQALLAAHRDLTLEKRAEIADSVADIYGPLGNIAEATATTSTTSVNVRLDYLESALTTALQELAAIKINTATLQEIMAVKSSPQQESHRSRSRFRSRSRSTSQQRRARAGDICWYHWRFGDQANRCENPCKFSTDSVGNEKGSR